MLILSYEKNIIDKILNFIKLIILTAQGVNEKEVPQETEQDYYHNTGCIYLRYHNYRKALDYFEKMVKTAPEDFLGYQRRADVYQETERYKLARENYELALQKARAFKNKNKRNIDVKSAIAEIKKELAQLKGK